MSERLFSHIDWIMLTCALLLSGAGLITMHSFDTETLFFHKQILWLGIGVVLFFALSFIDYRFLKRTVIITSFYAVTIGVLLVTLSIGAVFQGAQSWLDFGGFSVQSSDPTKLVVILVLAKYFSRRHVEIAHVRHVLVSGMYVALIAGLIFLQPDFGSAIIIGAIWCGMVMVSGISKSHLIAMLGIGLCAGIGLWTFVLEDYQKERITIFLNPYTDIQGAGYNAYQSTIAVGSGQLLGKGIGYGTQSKLRFLPEYETDFIFAAFSEEWGFVGATLVLVLYAILVARIVRLMRYAASNFESLVAAGVATLIVTHVTIHVGMNIGLLPITGTTIPFMSYGGSHVVTEFAALGMLMGMQRYARVIPHTVHRTEFVAEG